MFEIHGNMATIRTREDISLLVNTFYAKVRKKEGLSHFFNQMIVGEDAWAVHLDKLTDFWETQLLMARTFKGNPMAAHIKVDKTFNQEIEMKHFGLWLNLWYETIDELFEGEVAHLAKNKARNMSHFIFMEMYKHRGIHSNN